MNVTAVNTKVLDIEVSFVIDVAWKLLEKKLEEKEWGISP